MKKGKERKTGKGQKSMSKKAAMIYLRAGNSYSSIQVGRRVRTPRGSDKALAKVKKRKIASGGRGGRGEGRDL